ncbi:DUF4418 family protein [Orbaceae bacterium ac157xtp]
MTNKLLISVLVFLIGLLVITVPLYIFPVCNPMVMDDGHGHTSIKMMKCFWTARAELGIGLVVIACSLVLFIAKNALIRLGISYALIFIALLIGAIPTVLIGICPNTMMLCNMGTLPALMLLSGALLLISIVNSIYLCKKHG